MTEPRIGGALAWRQAGIPFEERPPYQQLVMADVRRAEKTNGLTLVSTFSGCGGSSMGFRLAGYHVLWANEFIPAARETYLANFPTTTVDPRDIREVTPEHILEVTGLGSGQLDVLEGSPPCASFSMSGRREEGWGKVRKYSDSKQRVDDLFFEFIRILRGLRPRAFVAENVPGLERGLAKNVLRDIVKQLRESGYRVEHRKLDASQHGVPQARERIIFIGIRSDLDRDPEFPIPLTYRYGVEDVCPWLTQPGIACPLPMDDEDVGHTLLEGYQTTAAIQGGHYAPGDTSNEYFSLSRLRAQGPAQTILAAHGAGKQSAAGVCSPWGERKLHIPEVRRVCGFPDDFVVTGKYSQRWERFGRAVPPRLMEAVARQVARTIQR